LNVYTHTHVNLEIIGTIALRLLDRLDIVKLEHVPRGANKMADALVSLVATLELGAEEEMTIPVCSH